MYPTPDYSEYSTDAQYSSTGHGSTPATGIPNNPSLRQPIDYHVPYIFSVQAPAGVGAGKWSSRLCHCCDDPENSCACQGALYGVLLMTTGHACLYSCFYRSKLRGQYDLEESPCVDCLVHCCCETCALCQEYRELKSRGFDMGIGWEANLDRQRRGVTVAPMVSPGMMR